MINLRSQKGFIEAAIIGVYFFGFFASAGLLALSSAREKSRDLRRVSDIKIMASAIELYTNDKDNSPDSLESTIPSYLNTLREAPVPADGICTFEDNQYEYKKTGKIDFQISFCLGAETSGLRAGKHNFSQDGFK